MSYMALYRKFRPKNFSDVIGQDHIVKTLKNQINKNRVSHAYLFCGTRGTGKTSTAKIFAKAINCLSEDNHKPCNKCEICLAIAQGRSTNVIEIDAASNNGVENIRDIREDVRYPPTEGKYKVYIIDEVHMLSVGAFNALLKTLEEPPEHVIFILATTDPQKIPATVLSRCQRFDFRRITADDMVKNIKLYMLDENVSISDEALKYISVLADGALRDALSIVDQCIAFYFNESITLDMVLDIVGSVDKEVFHKMSNAFSDYDSIAALNIIEDLSIKGRDINQFVSELILYFRNILIVKNLNNSERSIDISLENLSTLKKIGDQLEQNILIEYINVLSTLQTQLKYAKNPRIIFEVCCIKICNPKAQNSYEAIFTRMKKLEDIISKGVITQPAQELPTKNDQIKSNKEKIKEKAVPEDIKKVIDSWKSFIKNLSVVTSRFLDIGYAGYLEGDILYIVCNDITSRDYIKKNSEEEIKNKLLAKYNKEFKIVTIFKDDYSQQHKILFGEIDKNDSEFNTNDIWEKLNIEAREK